jgi:hypothetical protein
VVPKSDDTRVFYFPRLDTGIVARLLRDRRYENIRIAASHFRDRSIARALAEAARDGAHVEIIAHHTKRRVPSYIEQSLKSANIDFHRYAHPDQLPMHSKFILLAAPGFRRALVGSMNLTLTSRWLNHEILLEVDQPDFYDAFNIRWEQMLGKSRGFAPRPESRILSRHRVQELLKKAGRIGSPPSRSVVVAISDSNDLAILDRTVEMLRDSNQRLSVFFICDAPEVARQLSERHGEDALLTKPWNNAPSCLLFLLTSRARLLLGIGSLEGNFRRCW